MGKKPEIIDVDFSLFAGSEAFGRIYGSMKFPVCPNVGDKILFSLSSELPEGVDMERPSGAILKPISVMDRVFSVESGKASFVLSLSDVIVSTTDEAEALMKYLERVHGLFGDPYDV